MRAAKLPKALKFPIDRVYTEVEKSVCPPPREVKKLSFVFSNSGMDSLSFVILRSRLTGCFVF